MASSSPFPHAGRSRLGAYALAAGSVLFLLYQAVRPFTDTAETIASTAWVTSHLLAVGGFVLITLGLLGMQSTLADSPMERLAARTVVVTWLGAGLTLPYYGAEVFGLNVIAQRSLRDGDPSLMELADQFRYGTAPVTLFTAGLALLGIGGIMAAIAVWRSGVLPRWSGLPLAAGLVLLIPQFFTPQPVRIVHGALVAAGGIWVAVCMLRASSARPVVAPRHGG